MWAKAISAQGTVKATPGSVNVPVVCAGAIVQAGDVIVGDMDGVVVVPRDAAADIARLGTERVAKEQKTRERLRNGELGLDFYGFRARLAELGVRYVDEEAGRAGKDGRAVGQASGRERKGRAGAGLREGAEQPGRRSWERSSRHSARAIRRTCSRVLPTRTRSSSTPAAAAMRELGKVLDETKPDVIVFLGSDHVETFSVTCIPSFAIIAGSRAVAKFAGRDYNLPVHREMAEDLLEQARRRARRSTSRTRKTPSSGTRSRCRSST